MIVQHSDSPDDSPDDALGPTVRLWGISPDELPRDDTQASRLAIKILREAVPFIDSVPYGSPHDSNSESYSAESGGWKCLGSRASAPSTAPVALYRRVVPHAALARISPLLARGGSGESRAGETWTCRRSVHDDAALVGTASWAEVTRAFRRKEAGGGEKSGLAEEEDGEEHNPTMVGSRSLRRWGIDGEDGDDDAAWLELGGRRWGGFSMELVETRHRIAPCGLLRDRVFTTLIVTASNTGVGLDAVTAKNGNTTTKPSMARTTTSTTTAPIKTITRDEFVVVSVPVRDADAVPGAEFSHDRAVVRGAYAGVEKFRLTSDGRSCWRREIEWTMTTAADACGAVPAWVQRKAVPGQVARDVGAFVAWAAARRGRKVEGGTMPERKRIVGGEKAVGRRRSVRRAMGREGEGARPSTRGRRARGEALGYVDLDEEGEEGGYGVAV
jgi:hypothetical protein